MFTAEEASKERVDAYVGALEHEKEGYKARIAGLKAGRQDRLTSEQLATLVKGVDAELARVKKVKPVEVSEDEAEPEE